MATQTNQASSPPPDKFKGDGDSARRFFQRFELYAASKEWTTEAKKATQVMLLLGDASFDYAVELPDATRASYTELKKALLKHYETGNLSDNYIMDFQSTRYSRGEDPLLYMSKLKRMAEKAYPDMAAEPREKLVLSQFTLGLPVELRRQVHLLDVKPETAAELVEKVKFFAQVDSSLTGGACSRVEESETPSSEMSIVMAKLEDMSREISAWKEGDASVIARVGGGARGGRAFRGTCFKCRRTGHMARDCPGKANQPGALSRSSFTCYTCGNDGHMSSDCALNRRVCSRCGNVGHKQSDCKYTGGTGLNY